MPVVPPPPPRAASSPSLNEGALWQAIGTIQSDVAAIKVAQASQNASTRSQTVQIICGCVLACVTAVFGARATAPTPAPTQTVIQRSAFDRALDSCKALQSDADRASCIVKVAADAAGPSPR